MTEAFPLDVDLRGPEQLVAIHWAGERLALDPAQVWQLPIKIWMGRPLDRRYFYIERPGLRCVVYRDRIAGTWHMDKVFKEDVAC